jgi:hypothetical protein
MHHRYLRKEDCSTHILLKYSLNKTRALAVGTKPNMPETDLAALAALSTCLPCQPICLISLLALFCAHY